MNLDLQPPSPLLSPTSRLLAAAVSSGQGAPCSALWGLLLLCQDSFWVSLGYAVGTQPCPFTHMDVARRAGFAPSLPFFLAPCFELPCLLLSISGSLPQRKSVCSPSVLLLGELPVWGPAGREYVLLCDQFLQGVPAPVGWWGECWAQGVQKVALAGVRQEVRVLAK